MSTSQPERIAGQILTDFILPRTVVPGERLPSVRELKERYATTNTTICAALALLENQGRVRREHGRGNFVTEPALAAGPAAPRLLGFILPTPDGSPSMVTQITTGVERAARAAGYQILLGLSHDRYDEERETVTRLTASGCAGLVLVPTVRLPEQLRADYLNDNPDYPIVLVDMAFPEQRRSQVLIDNHRAGYEVTRWLLAEGHRRIAFMDWLAPRGEVLSRSVRDRWRGHLAALAEAGLAPRPADHWRVTFPTFGGGAIDEARARVRDWAAADTRERPTALIALNDPWAVVMINFLRDLGVRVPEELRVTGFDNCPTIAHFRPPFPTSNPDFARLGETAVELLLQHLNGELTAPVHYMLPAPILARGAKLLRPEPQTASV